MTHEVARWRQSQCRAVQKNRLVVVRMHNNNFLLSQVHTTAGNQLSRQKCCPRRMTFEQSDCIYVTFPAVGLQNKDLFQPGSYGVKGKETKDR